MDNYKIQQRKLMGWGEPIPFSSFLNRYDASTIWDLASRGKLQVLNPDNRVLVESELADLLNEGYVPAKQPSSQSYSDNVGGMKMVSQSSGQIEQLSLKVTELEGHMETIYDEMQQREADWVQKVEEMQKRFDQQFLAFQKKIDHKFSTLKATAPKRNTRQSLPPKEMKKEGNGNSVEVNNTDKPTE